jgi:hypothetical protein
MPKKTPTKPKSAFFATSRAKLEAGLERVGRDLCAYVYTGFAGRATCDCKYGIGAVQAKFGRAASTEMTGCPEVHQALAMVRAMTNREYDSLVRRAGGM